MLVEFVTVREVIVNLARIRKKKSNQIYLKLEAVELPIIHVAPSLLPSVENNKLPVMWPIKELHSILYSLPNALHIRFF